MKKKWNQFKRWLYKEHVDTSELSVIFFKIRLFWIRKFGSFNRDYRYTPEQGHVLVFDERFTSSKLNHWKWRVGQHWGKLHPDNPYEYVDKSCVNIVNNRLEFSTKHAPKDITQWIGQPKQKTWKQVPYARGEISSKNKYHYGVYEMRCKIPLTTMSAFWLAGGGKHEEIDIFEYFTKDNRKRTKEHKITAHWNRDGTRYMTPKDYRLPLSFVNDFHIHTFKWYKHKLEFLIDGVIIRRITNKKLLATFSNPMDLIINVYTEDRYPTGDKLIVDYFTHWAYEL